MRALWVLWFSLPYACLLIWLVAGFLRAKGARLFLLGMGGLALAGGVIYAFLIHAGPWSQDSLFYNLDDASYDRWGREIAETWRRAESPDLTNEHVIGTLHTGYYRFVAALYYIAGPNPKLGILFNLLACAALPWALFFIGAALWDERAARRAALLGALYPTFWFHSVFLMRDAWITLFFLALLGALLEAKGLNGIEDADRMSAFPGARPARPYHHSSFIIHHSILLIPFLAVQLFLLRYYLLGIFLAGWALMELTIGRRRKWAWIAVAALAVVAVALRMDPDLAEFENWLGRGFLWSIPRDQSSLRTVALRFAEGLPKFFLAPLAWATEGGYVVDYFLWPGQWMMYLLLLPYGLWGMIWAARRGPRETFLLVFPFIASVYAFIVIYGGAVPRQRMFLDALLILFTAIALAEKKKSDTSFWRWLTVYYVCFGLFFATHVGSLFWRGIWKF